MSKSLTIKAGQYSFSANLHLKGSCDINDISSNTLRVTSVDIKHLNGVIKSSKTRHVTHAKLRPTNSTSNRADCKRFFKVFDHKKMIAKIKVSSGTWMFIVSPKFSGECRYLRGAEDLDNSSIYAVIVCQSELPLSLGRKSDNDRKPKAEAHNIAASQVRFSLPSKSESKKRKKLTSKNVSLLQEETAPKERATGRSTHLSCHGHIATKETAQFASLPPTKLFDVPLSISTKDDSSVASELSSRSLF